MSTTESAFLVKREAYLAQAFLVSCFWFQVVRFGLLKHRSQT